MSSFQDPASVRRTTGEQPPVILAGIDWQRVAIGVLSLLTAIGMILAGWVGSELGRLREKLEAVLIESARRDGSIVARIDGHDRDIRELKEAKKCPRGK